MKPAALTLMLVLAATAARAGEVTVQRRSVDDRKAVFATVESLDVTPARARNAGTVAELEVDEGSRVSAGQRIAAVADAKLRFQIDAADQRIRALEAQRQLAETDLRRIRELRSSGTVPQTRLDDAETRLSVVQRDLGALRSERQVLAERIDEGAVLAPATGRVLRVHVIPGTVVLPGEPIATIAAENYILRLRLPERHARFIKPGDTVLLGARGLAAGDEPPRPGTVRQVYPEIDAGRVIADVEATGLGDYFVGERVKVSVATGRRDTFVLPAAALYHRFGIAFVRLTDGSEVVVQPGPAVDGGIEILAGLRDGDVVVTP